MELPRKPWGRWHWHFKMKLAQIFTRRLTSWFYVVTGKVNHGHLNHGQGTKEKWTIQTEPEDKWTSGQLNQAIWMTANWTSRQLAESTELIWKCLWVTNFSSLVWAERPWRKLLRHSAIRWPSGCRGFESRRELAARKQVILQSPGEMANTCDPS